MRMSLTIIVTCISFFLYSNFGWAVETGATAPLINNISAAIYLFNADPQAAMNKVMANRSAEDRLYFQQQLKNMTEYPLFVVDDDGTFTIWGHPSVKLKTVNAAKGEFTVNGEPFLLQLDKSLEVNHKNLIRLMKRPSPLSFSFLPSAVAGGAIDGVGIVQVVMALVALLLIYLSSDFLANASDGVPRLLIAALRNACGQLKTGELKKVPIAGDRFQAALQEQAIMMDGLNKKNTLISLKAGSLFSTSEFLFTHHFFNNIKQGFDSLVPIYKQKCTQSPASAAAPGCADMKDALSCLADDNVKKKVFDNLNTRGVGYLDSIQSMENGYAKMIETWRSINDNQGASSVSPAAMH